jgi:hypothetical protein
METEQNTAEKQMGDQNNKGINQKVPGILLKIQPTRNCGT